MTIRSATPDDAAALLGIYAPYVTNTAITFELEPPSVEEFSERIREIQQKFPYLLAEEDGKVIGYTYAHTFRQRAAYNHCVEMTIYIDRDNRRSGVGTALYAALEKQLKAMGIINLCASITTTEMPDPYVTDQSQLFHKHLGYTKVAHFHKCGHKFNRWYDMIWMEKFIGEHYNSGITKQKKKEKWITKILTEW